MGVHVLDSVAVETLSSVAPQGIMGSVTPCVRVELCSAVHLPPNSSVGTLYLKKAGIVISESSTDTVNCTSMILILDGTLAIVSEAPTDTGTDAVLAIVSEGATNTGSVAPTVKGLAEGNRSPSWILMRLIFCNSSALVMGSIAPILAVVTRGCVLW